MNTIDKGIRQIAVIVAHPDDETLWAGGSILADSFEKCFILSLCRKNDTDRAPRFYKALSALGATGTMADLDDGPEQNSLPETLVEKTVLENLPDRIYDRVFTHCPIGEYTRHIRHEETGRAVLKLWLSGIIQTKEILMFAYEDGKKKYRIITDIYNFSKDSFEAATTPETEAFWQIQTRVKAEQWLKKTRSD